MGLSHHDMARPQVANGGTAYSAYNNNNNNNNYYYYYYYYYLLQLGCHPVAVVILHVYKT